MGNWRDKFARFMYGRYGIDQLYNALLVAALVLLLANCFIRSSFIGILVWTILIWMVFRTLSRNVYQRSRENEMFLKAWNPVKASGSLTIRRIKEVRTHRFRKCPYCKAILRLPRKAGKHSVNCPHCHKEFKLRIIF